MRAIARVRIGTRLELIMRAIDRTHESDVNQIRLSLYTLLGIFSVDNAVHVFFVKS